MSLAANPRFLPGLALVCGLFAIAQGAQAAAPCRAPVQGEVVAGPVLHVPDGARLCVALGFEDWVELTVAGPEASDSRDRLMSAAFAKNATCVVTRGTAGQVNATCRVEGRELSALLAHPNLVKAAQVWR